jgi:hypothetical protein
MKFLGYTKEDKKADAAGKKDRTGANALEGLVKAV